MNPSNNSALGQAWLWVLAVLLRLLLTSWGLILSAIPLFLLASTLRLSTTLVLPVQLACATCSILTLRLTCSFSPKAYFLKTDTFCYTFCFAGCFEQQRQVGFKCRHLCKRRNQNIFSKDRSAHPGAAGKFLSWLQHFGLCRYHQKNKVGVQK